MVTAKGVVLGYADAAAGIALAAVVSNRVSVTALAVALAAAVLEVFGWLAVAVVRRAGSYGARRGFQEHVWLFPAALFLAAPALFIAGLVVAARVVPDLNVNGAFGYLVLGVVVFGFSIATDRLLWDRVWPRRPQSS